MISGANEKELDLATARADILLMCGAEQLKMVDEYYENQITNLQQENKQLKEEKRKAIEVLKEIEGCDAYIKEVLAILGDKE